LRANPVMLRVMYVPCCGDAAIVHYCTGRPALTRGLTSATRFAVTLSPVHLPICRTIMTRPSGRQPDELRPITMQRGFTTNAAGSVLISFGDTRVLCTASVEE